MDYCQSKNGVKRSTKMEREIVKIDQGAFSDCLRRLMDESHTTKYQLAKELNFSQSSIANWLNKTATPSKRSIEVIADYFGVSPSYLVTSNTDYTAYKKDKPVPAPKTDSEIEAIFKNLNEAGRLALCAYGRFLGSQAEYRAAEKSENTAPTRIIPFLPSSFAAGTPETPGDLFMSDYETTDPHAEFAIRINGNSMEPYLHDGSVALGVKRAPRDGEVGAFYLDGGFLVKQVCQDSQSNVYLFSLNRERADADEMIWHDSGRDLRCVGTILMDKRIPLP